MVRGNKFKPTQKPGATAIPAADKVNELSLQAGVINATGSRQNGVGSSEQRQQPEAARKRLIAQGPAKEKQPDQPHSKELRQEPKPAVGLRHPPTSNERRKARRKALKRAAKTAKKQQAAQAKPAGPAKQLTPAPKPDSRPEERPRKKARKDGSAEAPQSIQPDAAAPRQENKPDSAQEVPAREGKKAHTKRPQPPKPDIKTILDPPKTGDVGNSNWAALKAVIGGGGGRRKEVVLKGSTPNAAAEAQRPQPRGDNLEPTNVLAVDCEMVGVGPDGARSSLARVCIVNEFGNVLLDALVRQKERVTDFRTQFSGIRPADISDHAARPFEEVQAQAAALFKGRILVGHAINNDLKALLLSHPRKMIRDTSRYPPLMRSTAPGRKPRPRALRHLAFELLGLGIQEGEHSPVEDARAALYLYQRFASEWERRIQTNSVKHLAAPLQLGGVHKPVAAGRSLAELAAKDVMVDL